MKLAITIYPDDFAQADRIIHLLKQERGLELDGYMGRQHYDKNFDKPRDSSFAGSETGRNESDKNDDTDETSTSHQSTRPNIDPGAPSISKIGTTAKSAIIEALKQSDRAPDYGGGKYIEHFKLLWSRGDIKFDGQAYYL